MTPFTYRIYHIPTKMHYMGVRYSNNCCPTDLWTSYYTSSKLVKELIKYFGKDSFEIRRIKTFNTRAEALIYEQKFLTRIDAANRNNWLNQSNGGRSFAYHPIGAQHWNFGRKHSDDTIKKMRKPKSDEHKHNISKSNTGKKQTASHIQKRVMKNIGQARSTEQRAHMSNGAKRRFKQKHVWVNKNGIDKQIPISSFEEYISIGFTRGRSKGMNGLRSFSQF